MKSQQLPGQFSTLVFNQEPTEPIDLLNHSEELCQMNRICHVTNHYHKAEAPGTGPVTDQWLGLLKNADPHFRSPSFIIVRHWHVSKLPILNISEHNALVALLRTRIWVWISLGNLPKLTAKTFTRTWRPNKSFRLQTLQPVNKRNPELRRWLHLFDDACIAGGYFKQVQSNSSCFATWKHCRKFDSLIFMLRLLVFSLCISRHSPAFRLVYVGWPTHQTTPTIFWSLIQFSSYSSCPAPSKSFVAARLQGPWRATVPKEFAPPHLTWCALQCPACSIRD